MSATFATFSACHGSWISVQIGNPYISFTFCNILIPSSIPGPLNPLIDVLLALSNDV